MNMKWSYLWGSLLFVFVACEKVPWKHPALKVKSKTAAGTALNITHHIVNGNASKTGQFAWMVFIAATKEENGWYYTSYCGGSLISPRWVLTAAHCIDDYLLSILIRLGSLYPFNGGFTLTSTVYNKHPGYNEFGNDIGLIKLPSTVTLSSTIKVIKILPIKSSCADVLRSLLISGWGLTSDGGGLSNILRYAQVMEIRDLTCMNTYYDAVVTPNVICTQGASTQSTCSGDSGGSLSWLSSNIYYLVGVISFGAAVSCEMNYPAGYTEVAPYLDWIQFITGLKL